MYSPSKDLTNFTVTPADAHLLRRWCKPLTRVMAVTHLDGSENSSVQLQVKK